MPEPVVEFSSVTKRYSFKCQDALSDLDLKIAEGTSYGLIGRNGAGKTTALRLMLGMLRPTRGIVEVLGGDPIYDAERVKADVGYVAEDFEYPGLLRPVDLFEFFSRCYPGWDDAFLHELVEKFRVPVRDTLDSLSKGQRRQVGLLCAIAHRPRLLLLDEPGGGLDPVVRREFLEEVIELLLRERTTVIFSSHSMPEVERIAARIGVLYAGRLILEEDTDALLLVVAYRAFRGATCETLGQR